MYLCEILTTVQLLTGMHLIACDTPQLACNAGPWSNLLCLILPRPVVCVCMHACLQVEKDAVLQQPQITVVTSSVNFDAIDLTIHSHAADWLYQAVLMLFRGQ